MGTCEDLATDITLHADLPSDHQQQRKQQQQSLIQKLHDSHIHGDEDDQPDEIGGEIEGDVEEDESRDISYPLMINGENCSFYMKTGSCKFGFNCRFNHLLNRTDQVVDVDVRDHDVQQGFDDPGKILCKLQSSDLPPPSSVVDPFPSTFEDRVQWSDLVCIYPLQWASFRLSLLSQTMPPPSGSDLLTALSVSPRLYLSDLNEYVGCM